jgi:hypothetical protein
MSDKLHNFITNVLSMPHYANDSRGSGVKHDSHEDALTNELIKVGFNEIPQEGERLSRPSKKNPVGRFVKTRTFPKLSRNTLKSAIESPNKQAEIAKLVPGLKPGEFIRQPCGSQSFPDFLVRDADSGVFILVEAKSGNGIVPSWNDSLVKKDAIYIFSSGTYNSSTVFLGQDVLDPNREKILTDAHENIRRIVEETMKLLSATPDSFNRGFGYYVRPKFEQGGGKAKVDYFKHADRQQCESNVLSFVASL